MTNKHANLQTALETAKAAPPLPAAADQAKATTRGETRVNIAAWLDPGFKVGLRLVQAKVQAERPRRPCSIQDLMAEALNDLFGKYGLPPVTNAAE